MYRRISVVLHRTALRASQHDVLNLAQSAAYSAIVALFPALIVAATFFALLPGTTPIRVEVTAIFYRFLPADVTPLVEGYFAPSWHARSAHVLIGAIFVSVMGASAVITTFMEGLKRAHNLPPNCWNFWRRRARSFELVLLALVPLGIASALVVFGNLLTIWLIHHVVPEIRSPVYVIASVVRWIIAFTGSVGIISVLYHMGTPLRQPWRWVVPGAIAATAMWFLTTLSFGWYVTRFTNYSQVYGSLGAGIALLFWLYIVSLSVLCGAEFNEQFRLHLHHPESAEQPRDESAEKPSNSTV
jgi:membrane protein